MDFDSKGPVLKPLLLIGGQSSRIGTRKELLSFPDGRLAFEHALSTIHSAVPSASIIFVSIHDESQRAGIDSRLRNPAPLFVPNVPTSHDDDDHPVKAPALQVILDEAGPDVGPAAGLLAAHSLHLDTKWLVLGCDYPLLPASALQQLILEYQDPVTCFVNEDGFAEPLIGIWSPEALKKLKENVKGGRGGLHAVIKALDGKLVRPLRELWIKGANTRDEWEDLLKILKGEEPDD